MAKFEPFFSKSHRMPRLGDKHVLFGIVFINRNGLRWRDAPKTYGPHKTLSCRWKWWSEKAIFARMLLELSGLGGSTDTLVIDATHLKISRTASSLGQKGGRSRVSIARQSLLAAMKVRAHQRRDEFQAAHRHGCVGTSTEVAPDWWSTQRLDRRYDADWYREALEIKAIRSCIPSRKGRKTPIPDDKTRYRKHHKIKNSFTCLKDWRRVATYYDRCPKGLLVSLRSRSGCHMLTMNPDLTPCAVLPDDFNLPVGFYKVTF